MNTDLYQIIKLLEINEFLEQFKTATNTQPQYKDKFAIQMFNGRMSSPPETFPKNHLFLKSTLPLAFPLIIDCSFDATKTAKNGKITI